MHAPFSASFRDEFYRLLQSRTSIRKYKKDEVPRDVVERIIAAGEQAPSGKNLQNWRFYVLTGPKRDEYVQLQQKSWVTIRPLLENRLKPSLFEFTERFFFTLGDAPVIVLCYSLNDAEEQHLTSVGSVYMAVENMNLAALTEGLGCCTMGAPLEIKDEVNRFTGADQLPEFKEGRMELLCALVLGYPDHQPPKAPRQSAGRMTWL